MNSRVLAATTLLVSLVAAPALWHGASSAEAQAVAQEVPAAADSAVSTVPDALLDVTEEPADAPADGAGASSAAAPQSTLLASDVVRMSGAPADVLALALAAIDCAVTSGTLAPPPTLTLIDYSKPSVEPRLWVFDLATGELLFKELVAHGRGTGENLATRFSDELNSHQTSLGLFVTGDTYVGSNGYSLRLDGLEPGFNGRARERAIVMHGAPYVDGTMAMRQGRLGRSWGCPALRQAVAHQVIDTIRGGGVIFSYYPETAWLTRSKLLNCGTASREPLVAAK